MTLSQTVKMSDIDNLLVLFEILFENVNLERMAEVPLKIGSQMDQTFSGTFRMIEFQHFGKGRIFGLSEKKVWPE